MLISELLAQYQAFARGHYASTDEFRHIRLIAGGVDDCQLAAFGPKALKAYQQKMIARGWARTYINAQVRRLKRAFRWAVSEELIPVGALTALECVGSIGKGRTAAKETSPIKPAIWDAVVALRPFLDRVIWDMVEVQWLSGIRSGEMCAMSTIDLDRTSEQDGLLLYSPPQHKTAWRGMAKTVVFGPNAAAIINRNAGNLLNSRVFRSPYTHRQYTTESYRKALARGRLNARRAGVTAPRWHAHQLRHSRATAVEAQYGREAAAAALGDTIDVTAIYAERNLELAKRVAKETG